MQTTLRVFLAPQEDLSALKVGAATASQEKKTLEATLRKAQAEMDSLRGAVKDYETTLADLRKEIAGLEAMVAGKGAPLPWLVRFY